MKKTMKEWLVDVAKRTIKTACETFCGFITVGLTIGEIDWKYALSVTAVATIYTVIANLPGIPLGEDK